MYRVAANKQSGSLPARFVGGLPRWPLTTLVACLAFAMLLAATLGVRAQDANVDEAARAMLPEALRESGVLHVGLEVNYAPWMYQDGSNVVGIDPDLIRAIAARLGLKPEFAFVAFAAILPGVQSGRFDVGANFANTAERSKVVSFVNYLDFVGGLVVLKGNPQNINAKKLCGLRISSGVGTFSHANLEKLNEQCVKDGKPAITIVSLAPTDGIAALRTGRVDAADVGMVANVYAASQPGGQDLEALKGAPRNAVSAKTLGYITSKGPDGIALARAMAAALNAMIKSGEYAAILKKGGVPDEAQLEEAFAS